MSVLVAPVATENRQVFIETLGCQMNKADSELMLGLLAKEGFVFTDKPEQADLLIMNTCQIRENAEEKAYKHLDPWGKLKRAKPNLKIAMAGCVAQQTKEDVFKRLPFVDMVFGTQNIYELPQLVRRVFDEGEQHVVAVDKQKEHSTFDYFDDITQVRQSGGVSAWVTIIEGCDYFCTYCVVPYTRGRQISRKPKSILDEVKSLVAQGYKELTLLGQTVDSYGKDFKDEHSGYDLADLMRQIHEIEGLQRIRFMTSHPLDLSDRIIEAIAELPNVMDNIHIPMQSGDDAVLERMRRGYTSDDYYRLCDKLYERIPNVALTSDYIVGFPAETEEQFLRSVYSVARSGIYMANTAVYSARKQTPAGLWETRDHEQAIADEVKQERLQTLNAAITKQATSHNAQFLGQTLEILVEGPSRRNPNRFTGRDRQNKVVNFDAFLPEGQPLESLLGQLIPVQIIETLGYSLMARYEAPHL
jgi:tRNA-2-methylthio-N6-dimethylallyladenosine synthase